MFYAFTGFGALAIVAGDIENPRKNVPRALLVFIAVVALAEKLLLGTGASFVGAYIYLFMRWRYGGQSVLTS